MNASLELANMEIKATKSARMQVAAMLQRPEQLDKVEQLRKRVTRRKGSVEAMLKTAIQSQLDGVKTGMVKLSTSLKDIKEVHSNLDEIIVSYKEIENMKENLKNIREEAYRHSQLSAACDNVMQIFTVPETIKKCENLIAEGKLLHAHKCISDLENSRNDLLYELHKQSIQSPTDQYTVNSYFSGLERLVELLGKQLWLILQRTIISLRVEPTIIVTSFRIIEREERMDNHVQRRYDDQFKVSGRPRQWKAKAMQVLEDAVLARIEGNQMEDRDTNKMWLVRHLEVSRQIVLEDLKVVKTLSGPVFPMHYNMTNRYFEMYHNAVSSRLNEIISQGLVGNEVISMLTWINEYASRDLMGHSDLNIDVTKFKPLVEKSKILLLQDQYVSSLRLNFKEWMGNSLKTDSKDWMREVMPDSDDKGFYGSSITVLVIQMIEQNLEVAKIISKELVTKVVGICIDELKEFITIYKNELRNFHDVHFTDRRTPMYYLLYMMANTNNCQTFATFINLLHDKYFKNSNPAPLKHLLDMFNQLASTLCDWLLEEVCIDLNPHFQDLFSKKWVTSNIAVDTICVTLDDYCHDFTHLQDVFYHVLISKAQDRVAKEYYKALLSRKITFKNYEERLPSVEKIQKEAAKLKSLFQKLSKTSEDGGFVFDGISTMGEILKLKDTSVISLEISGFINVYPDMKIEQLVNLLLMRGDLGRTDARQIVVDCLGEDHDSKVSHAKKTILSRLNDK